MAATPAIVINKSGSIVNVYSSDGKTIVGQLLNREAFSKSGNEGDLVAIHFLGPNGSFIPGILKSPSGSVLTPCINYPYGTEIIDGIRYYTFMMRSTRTIVDKDGGSLESVTAGRKVACSSSLAGDSVAWRKYIEYFQDPSGVWIRVDKKKEGYGYVDTGLRTGSSPTSIAMYGSW